MENTVESANGNTESKVKKSKKEAVDPTHNRTNEMWLKNPFDFKGAIEKAIRDHWTLIEVTIKIRHRLYGGKPMQLDVAKAMLKARGLEDQIKPLPINPEERAELAQSVERDEGLCGFSRREGKTGIWMPSFFFKAGLKENFSCLRITQDKPGIKGEVHERIFTWAAGDLDPIERAWIRLGDGPDGIDESVCHSDTPQGKRSSIKRNEYVTRPEISFVIALANGGAIRKIEPEDLVRVMVHFSEHGLGANRSQSVGTFDIVKMEQIQ